MIAQQQRGSTDVDGLRGGGVPLSNGMVVPVGLKRGLVNEQRAPATGRHHRLDDVMHV